MSYATSTIKSIQSGTIAFGSSGSDAPTATITSIDTSKTSIYLLGVTAGTLSVGSTQVAPSYCRLELTNATTITATRAAGLNGLAGTLSYRVVEYY